MVSIKRILAILLESDPAKFRQYKEIKEGILQEFEDKQKLIENQMQREAIERAAAAEDIKLSPEQIAEQLLKVLNDYAGLGESDKPLEYNDYGYGLLQHLTRDLIVIKFLLRYRQELDYSQFAGKMTKDLFQKAANRTNHRFSYTAYFHGDPDRRHRANAGTTLTSQDGVFHQGGYYGAWMVPISRTWFRSVAMRGLATTDIAGKQVMTVSAYKAPEQPANPDEHITVYKAKVAYAKHVSKANLIEVTRALTDESVYKLTEVTWSDLSQDWVSDFSRAYNQYGVFLSEGRDLPRKLTPRSGTVDPRGIYCYRDSNLQKAKPPHHLLCGYNNTAFEVDLMEWRNGKKGFLEDRYIAVYQPPGSSKRKVASGTTPLRSVSVLRNRLKDEVLDEIGVLF